MEPSGEIQDFKAFLRSAPYFELEVERARELPRAVELGWGSMSDVLVRDAAEADWVVVWTFVRGIVGAGETYTIARDADEATARRYWCPAVGGTVVAVDGDVPVAIAKWLPNQGGRGPTLPTRVHGGSGVRGPGDRAGTGGARAAAGAGRRVSGHAVQTRSWRPTPVRSRCGSRSGSRSSAGCRRRSTTPRRGWSIC